MRRIVILCLMLPGVLAGTGCEPDEAPSPPEPPADATPSVDAEAPPDTTRALDVVSRDDVTDPPDAPLALFDGHAHMVPSWDPTTLPDLVDDHGLLGMAVLGPANIAQLQAQRPTEFVAFAFVSDVATVDLEKLGDALAAGARGIGEISGRHFAAGMSNEATTYSAMHPNLQAIYQLASDHGVPVNLHHDYSDDAGAELASALTAHPDTTFIWAHAGDTLPEFIAPLLDVYDNLYVDIACRTDLEPFTNRPFPMEDQRITEADGTLQTRWREFFDVYSDRVLFGSDIGPQGRLEIYPEILAYFRDALSQLTPERARRIGSENALTIFGL